MRKMFNYFSQEASLNGLNSAPRTAFDFVRDNFSQIASLGLTLVQLEAGRGLNMHEICIKQLDIYI